MAGLAGVNPAAGEPTARSLSWDSFFIGLPLYIGKVTGPPEMDLPTVQLCRKLVCRIVELSGLSAPVSCSRLQVSTGES